MDKHREIKRMDSALHKLEDARSAVDALLPWIGDKGPQPAVAAKAIAAVMDMIAERLNSLA